MNQSELIAKHLRDVYFGGNWTVSCLKDQLADVIWQQATARFHSFHTIAELVYHINYFVDAIVNLLRSGVLDANDKFSFDCPPIQSQEDWDGLLHKVWNDVEAVTALVERMPDSKLSENVADEKYGNYYRNLHGIVEHGHYHLGQIVMLKKILNEQDG